MTVREIKIKENLTLWLVAFQPSIILLSDKHNNVVPCIWFLFDTETCFGYHHQPSGRTLAHKTVQM